MRENTNRYPLYQRLLSLAMAALMVFGFIPLETRAAAAAEDYTVDHVVTVADPETIGRPGSVYQDDTLNAGKVTVGKSVHNGAVAITYGGNKTQTFTPSEDSFIVTSSQAAQVMGLASEITAPVDVVFVLDTSNSMEDEVNDLVTAANNAIRALLQANPDNRVGVVAFSGTSGRGTSGGAAANVLSPLAHYDGEGETAHLTLRGGYMYGRGTQGNTQLNRDATSQGTNIHAGIVVGAKELMNATDLKVNGVTRIPFLVVMSDGEPSYAVSSTNWYDPASLTGQIGNLSASAGLGFLPALTAAYYKGKITEKYFGADASKDNRCFIYTLGLGLDSISNRDLALMTVNPAGQTASNSFYNTFEGYWDNGRNNSYVGGSNFNIALSRGSYQVTADTITVTKNAVNGLSSTGASLGYAGGYKYNDKYFSASEGSQLNSAFDDVIISIQQQAMSAPTRVEETHGADFSGYVTFTDPIGEYMEVKNMYGVLADGNFYQGKSFAQYISNWDSAPAEFKTNMIKVLKERCRVTGATMTDAQAEAFLRSAAASANQAYYVSDTDYDNSIVWWGKSYQAEGEEDVQIQWLGFADNDTVEYIESAQKPAGADYVCRSYYFYGTAGGTAENSNNEYLHFVVRVQRSLKAPYQQTVVISAPASLLSMEKVLITEKTDTNGNTTYTATVTEADPARVVYEVGLRSDINAFNVETVLKEDAAYLGETAVNGGQTVNTNYDAVKGEYYFYTNDWDRTQAEDSHHRAMAHATFDAAPDNSFYTYTKDTPIYVKNGSTYTLYNGTEKPSGTYYYAREVYDWSASTASGNTHTAVKRTEYILVEIPADSPAVQKGSDSWYITKGAYKASSLSSAAEDVAKDPNRTGTSSIVVHPHRTEDANNSHYTVLLGNNGKLTLKAADTKSVDITKADSTQILGADGKVVMVGDVLTYTIQVINGKETDASAVVTDSVPQGTKFLSADHSGSYDGATKQVTWYIDNIPAGQYVEVSFQVEVTEDALSGDYGVASIDNTAYVTLSNGFSYTTNTTNNPPEGKKVVDTAGNAITGNVEIPQVLVYRIRWNNDSGSEATVTINDIIPAGTTYVENSASHGGVYDAAAQTVTWTLENVEAGASGVVSFRVNVNAAAGEDIYNDAEIQIGDNEPRVTNKATVTVAKGSLVLSKDVVVDAQYPDALTQSFTLHITEVGLGLNGNFPMLKNGVAVDGGITFTKGLATVTVQDGDELEIQGITAGAIFSVTEAARHGFTPTYTTAAGSSAAEGRVTIVENAKVSVAVTNTYAPEGVSFQLQGTKTLSTELPLEDITFGFAAYPCDASGEVTAGKAPLSGEVTVSSETKTAQFAFSPETYSAVGTYYYLISEIDGGVKGITYAKNQYLLTVVVSDNGTGKLQAAASLKQRADETGTFADADAVTFTNKYTPVHTQLVLEGTKVLNGLDLQADMFSFVVKDDAGKDVSYGTNDADGNIIFQAIPYSTTGSHSYTITEVNSGLKGMTYSAEEIPVTVTVEDVNGQLVATAQYPAGGVVFTNTFRPDDVSLTLTGTKTLTGRTMTAGEFSFRVTEEVGGQTVEVTTGRNDGSGNIIFTAIGYGLEDVGEHIYTVTEVKPDLAADPNLYYDPAVYQVKVVVSYDPSTGTLSYTAPEITKDGAAARIQFSNIQNPGYVDVPVVGRKQTTGNTVPADLSFSFSVVDMDGSLATGGSAPANGAISFTNLSYTTTGTYYYWIYETNHAGQTAHGVTYSAQRYLLEVTVTRDAYNKLTATTAYYTAGTVADTGKTAADYAIEANKISQPADNVLFENVYAAKGTANITAVKTLTDKTLVAGDFMFKLDRVDDSGNVLSTLYASNAADGSISFPTILVDSNDLPSGGEATVRYIMSEVVTDANRLPGVTYSDAKYYLTITFTDDGQGTITNKVEYYTDNTFTTLAQSQTEPVFANSYSPVTGTQAVITAKKVLEGRPLKAGEFSFNLYHVTTKDGVETETLVDTAVNAADGTVTFKRNYPAGVLNGADEITTKYVIREVNNHLGGVSYDGSNEGKGYPVTVRIVDNKDGTISCAVTYANGTAVSDVVFKNTYDAQDTTFTPEASKVLNNRTLLDREFVFAVKDTSGKTVSTGFNNANGSVTFTPIGYTEATAPNQPHVYTIHEVKGNLTNIAYSDAVYRLEVTVTDNQDGTMTATGKYYNAGGEEIAAPAFTNTFKPESVSIQFEATKVLENHPMNQGTFSFLVHDITGGRKELVATGGNAAAAADQTVPVTFSNIGYTFEMLGGADSKTFLYTITEQATTHSGVTADGTVYYAKVVLSHNADGTLTTAVTYHTDKSCTDANKITVPAFVNKYDPADTKVTLYADKTLINKDLQAGEFTFTLTPENGAADTAVNDANGRATFGELTFTAPGTYTYTISEAVTDTAKAGNYTLDHSFKVIVKVEDDLRGKLVATVTYHEIQADGTYDATVNLGGAEFINRYTASALTVDLTTGIGATKTVKAPDGVSFSKEGFTFQVTDTTGAVIKGRNAQGAEVDMIGRSDADGKIIFPSFYFSKAGEYHYWISEQPSNVEGMTDDLRVWEVHILVRYNEATGLLYTGADDIKTYLVGGAAGENGAITFVNTFEPAAVTLTLEATKLLEGRELRDREFYFHLLEGGIIVAEGHNDVEGKIRFDLTYTAEDIGSHAYTIKEVVPENAYNGITYDGTAYSAATVSVSYDTASHKLAASVGGTPVANGAVISTGVEVTNKYAAEGTAVQINANKVVTANRVLKDKEFTFGLLDSEGEVAATAQNDAAGWILFELSYDKAGTYTYQMFEQSGDDKSITYDTNRYTVTVTVTDDGSGKLNAQVAYKDGVVPTFVNEYRALPVTATIQAEKVLSGKTLGAGDFTFELESEDGAKVTAKNLAGGQITFSVDYDKAGVYTYTLREKSGSATGVTYDTAVYEITVTVTDDLQGNLKAEVTYGTADGKAPVFYNTYKKPVIPTTGDDTPIFLLAGIMFAAASGLVLLLTPRRKKAARS